MRFIINFDEFFSILVRRDQGRVLDERIGKHLQNFLSYFYIVLELLSKLLHDTV